MIIVDRIKVSELKTASFYSHRDLDQEIIKVKGFQVSPVELEGHLLSHPDVADVGVVGVRDEYAGQLPIAFVVLKAPAQTRVLGSVKDALDLKAGLLKVRGAMRQFHGYLLTDRWL